jgi:hypothetical protein
MKETAKQVTPTHPASLIPTHDGQPGRSLRRFEPQRPVRTVLVVVLDVDSQDLLQVASPDDQEPVKAVGADRTNPAFRVRVRPGRPPRREQPSAPSERNTSSKLRQNFASW